MSFTEVFKQVIRQLKKNSCTTGIALAFDKVVRSVFQEPERKADDTDGTDDAARNAIRLTERESIFPNSCSRHEKTHFRSRNNSPQTRLTALHTRCLKNRRGGLGTPHRRDRRCDALTKRNTHNRTRIFHKSRACSHLGSKLT